MPNKLQVKKVLGDSHGLRQNTKQHTNFLSSFKQKGRSGSGLSLIFHTLKQLLTPTTTIINCDLIFLSIFTINQPPSVCHFSGFARCRIQLFKNTFGRL
ncbi:hypothetical protein V6N12_051944 [Hibiscus sabdariffa]|uniref:Uncharacterized protein n=1 Tax=Hibiscus sabdariffa TaxID=183260 RepID=A0ABR2GHM3_9ROSI